MRNRGLIRLLCLAALAAGSASAPAAKWEIDPTLRLQAGYNDNVTMRAEKEVSSPVVIFSPSARFGVETPRSGLNGDLRFDFRRFTDQSNLDDDNVRLSVSSFYGMEQSQIGLDLGLIKDTTLDSELEQTGLVFNRLDRLQYSANPYWSWIFNVRTRLTLSYTYTDVSYSDTGNTGYVDFTSNNGQLSLVHMPTERMTLTLTAGQTRSQNEGNVDSTFSFLQGGATYELSDTLSTSLSAGARQTKSEFDNSPIPIYSGSLFQGFITVPGQSENSSTGMVFRASLTKRFERGRSNISASRNVTNAASGYLTEITRFDTNNSYNLSPTFSVNLGFTIARSRTPDDSPVNSAQDRDYYEITPGFDWEFEEFWRISASYRYRKQIYDNSSKDTAQNATYLTLTYRWPRMTVSR